MSRAAVLDTNVFASAAISPSGTPRRLVDAWRSGRFTLIISAPLIAEVTRILASPRLARRVRWTDADRVDFWRALAETTTLVEPTRRIAASRDPDDNCVLEAAVTGHADYIVTGDADLLELGSFEGTEIVTPARFLALLEAP